MSKDKVLYSGKILPTAIIVTIRLAWTDLGQLDQNLLDLVVAAGRVNAYHALTLLRALQAQE